MTDKVGAITVAKEARLKFIDMARSIAILLMLQGHFITLTLKEYQPLIGKLRLEGSSGNLLFDWWVKMRGFTAPLFFTITGLVFVYLLTKSVNKDEKIKFFEQTRVKKGIKRALSVIFWGYVIQMNLKYLPYYLRGHLNNQFFAFHILQSIGFGIGILLLIYGLYKWINKGALPLYYFIFGTLVFMSYPFLQILPEGQYFPANAPQLIQNMFSGPKSEFPLVPWLGFVLFGGMIGSILGQNQKYAYKAWFPYASLLFGFLLLVFGRVSGKILDFLLHNPNSIKQLQFEKNAWLYDRLAEVILLLSLLMIIEKIFKIKDSLFLKMGQNTFPIYILHVIILYGAITGYSLKDLFRGSLTSGNAIIGAILFILFFAVYVKFMEIIHEKFHHSRRFVHKKITKPFIRK
jgi:uncharacterized membrane protein